MDNLENLRKQLEQEKQLRVTLEQELALKKEQLERYVQKENEEKYRTVIETATDIVYKTDAKGYFTYVNPAAERIVGFAQHELLGMHFSSLIDPEYRERVMEFYHEQFKSRTPSTYLEYPIITRKGERLWLGQNVQLELTGTGWVNGVSSFARDISDRMKADEQLKLLNLRFSSIINNIHSGILLESSERRVVIANDTLCRMFNSSAKPEHVVDASCLDIFKSMKYIFKDGDAVIENMEACVQKREKQLNVEIALADGRIFERDYIPIFLNGIYTGHLWKYRDITEQKKIQQTLLESEEKYRRIIQNMKLGLLVVDNNDRIVDANPNFCEMTGYKQEEIMGWPAGEILLVSEESKSEIRKAQGLRKDGVSNAYEIQVSSKTGKPVWMMISGSPIYDSNHKLIGSIGIHLDITERKLQEVALREAHLKAEQSAHSKEVFLANMSHEVRTPMNAVLGMARLLEHANLTTKERGYLDAIKVSSENLLVIINDILDFSKIDQGKMQLEETTFSFSEMIKAAMVQFEFKFMEKNLSFFRKIDPAMGDIFRGDPTRLSQVLTNLISNSVKFTEEGHVSLSCYLVADEPSSQRIRFTVSDTGVGIEKDKLVDIFESFMQEDSTISRKYGGTGLGLTISKQLVKLFGGELLVESEKGKGSSFSFEIDLKKGHMADINKAAEVVLDYDRLRDLKVLLVEDNKLNQFVATAILDQFGAKTVLAANGKEALEKLGKERFDIVLMDLQMPVMGGLEATRLIREQLKSDVPVIALTANAIKGDSDKCLAAGMNDYISKPFTNIGLASKMLKYAPLKRYEKLEQASEVNTDKEETKTDDITVSYDLQKLLDGFEGNDEFARNMVDLFIETAEETMHDMEHAMADNNPELVKSLAHKIKPSIDIFNIRALTGLVRSIERPEDRINPSAAQVNEFVGILAEVVRQMENDKK
ncbi:MAG: PAS domain S-box protein [Bacteroidetes bacterium]|nr:PAS domain S-box protein [Bacteroidota bacterium]